MVRFCNILKLKMKLAPVSTMEERSIKVAVDLLRKGGVIALPTDTVYGLACSATNVPAINKLYAIKSRNENKPVAICVGEESDVHSWGSTSWLPRELIGALLPGPVTLILASESKLDKSLVFDGKVGVRIPDCNFIREIANGLGCPIALTSANVSSEPSSVSVEEFKGLWEKLDGVFDGGDLGDSNRGASTVVDLTSEGGGYKIVRKGIALNETVAVLKRHGLEEC